MMGNAASGRMRCFTSSRSNDMCRRGQREVWAALRTIEAGTTLSYGALARQLGRPKSVRAVGSANGANPVAIVVPSHRVIGADARLGQPDGISPSRMAEMLEVDKAGPKVRC